MGYELCDQVEYARCSQHCLYFHRSGLLLQESDVTPYDCSFPVNDRPPPLCELSVNRTGGSCEIVYISGFKERPTQVAQFFYLEYQTNSTLRLFGHS